MVLRKARHSDIPAIVDLSIKSVSRNPLPVRIDRQAITETITEGLGGNHFLMVAELDGAVVGVVGAMSCPSFWFERQQCSVMLYYSDHKGVTVRLLRELMRWIKGRPAIKVAVMELEPESDVRLIKLMKRIGFDRESKNLTYLRPSKTLG